MTVQEVGSGNPMSSPSILELEEISELHIVDLISLVEETAGPSPGTSFITYADDLDTRVEISNVKDSVTSGALL